MFRLRPRRSDSCKRRLSRFGGPRPFQRQARLGPVKRLYLRLFIHRQHKWAGGERKARQHHASTKARSFDSLSAMRACFPFRALRQPDRLAHGPERYTELLPPCRPVYIRSNRSCQRQTQVLEVAANASCKRWGQNSEPCASASSPAAVSRLMSSTHELARAGANGPPEPVTRFGGECPDPRGLPKCSA